MIFRKFLGFLTVTLLGCGSGNLTLVCDLPKSLNEVSGIASTANQKSFWMIEDSGNPDHIYKVSTSGKIIHEVNLDKSVKNTDWEALTSDENGNLYIGDFGNNNEKRKSYQIYEVSAKDLNSKNTVSAKKISFKLPKKQKALDFEAFFLMNNAFYIFSKEKLKTRVWKVPNLIGTQTAIPVTTFLFNENGNKITDAAINQKQNTIALLNHDSVWILKDFVGDAIFEGTILQLPFAHESQKEGLCFSDDDILYITDERVKAHGGKLYTFPLEP